MNLLNLFRTIGLLAIFSATLACTGVPSAMTSTSGNTGATTKISPQDWQQLIDAARTTPRAVVWRIRITEVGSFGGFYVKGHLLDSRSARVHLVWPPEETPSGALRNSLVEGGVVTIRGELEGVTTEGEAIIDVRECLH
jgi:hypothetical protein